MGNKNFMYINYFYMYRALYISTSLVNFNFCILFFKIFLLKYYLYLKIIYTVIYTSKMLQTNNTDKIIT